MNRTTLPLLVVCAMLATAARAQDATPIGPRTPDSDKLEAAADNIARMKTALKLVLGRAEQSRSEKDIVKLNCVNEKLTQIKGLLKVSEQAKAAAEEAMARRDESAATEIQKIGVASDKADKLRSEAEQCIGQLAFAVDQRTVVEVELPKDLPDRDLTSGEPPPPILSRPPPASRYY